MSLTMVTLLLWELDQFDRRTTAATTSAFLTDASSTSSVRRIQFKHLQDETPFFLFVSIDLSYRYHYTTNEIVNSLHQQLSHPTFFDSTLEEHLNKTDQIITVTDVDVSNSMLRDDGLKKVIDVVFNTTTTNNRSTIVLNFKARMNDVTQIGALDLLNRIFPYSECFNNITDTFTPDNADDESNSLNSTASNFEIHVTQRPTLTINRLDLSFNRLCNVKNGDSDSKIIDQKFRSLLEKVVSDTLVCPSELVLDRCCVKPSLCRSIAKGLMSRYEKKLLQSTKNTTFSEQAATATAALDIKGTLFPPPVTLSLCGNKDVGDSGCAALAASIRTIAITKEELEHRENRRENDEDSPAAAPFMMFKRLDLSSCEITDLGAQTLAVALQESASPLIGQLDLCYNRIGDTGAIWLGKAIQQYSKANFGLYKLDLSGNKCITDKGIHALLVAMQYGTIHNLILRSCSIGADGTELIGKVLRTYVLSIVNNDSQLLQRNQYLHIDLSGNHLGLLGSKEKKEPSLKSIATSTAAAYMNTGMNFLKKAGLVFPSTIESDDEEENKDNDDGNNQSDETEYGVDDNDDVDPTKGQCAIKALSNSFTNVLSNSESTRSNSVSDAVGSRSNIACRIKIGLRHTFCDTAGADALAAMIIEAKRMNPNVQLEFDMNLNPVLEDDTINALHGLDDYTLQEMAERHTIAMQQVRENRKRALEAARLAKARAEAQSVLDGFRMNQQYDHDIDEDHRKNNYRNKRPKSSYQQYNYGREDVDDDDDDVDNDNDSNHNDFESD